MESYTLTATLPVAVADLDAEATPFSLIEEDEATQEEGGSECETDADESVYNGSVYQMIEYPESTPSSPVINPSEFIESSSVASESNSGSNRGCIDAVAAQFSHMEASAERREAIISDQKSTITRLETDLASTQQLLIGAEFHVERLQTDVTQKDTHIRHVDDQLLSAHEAASEIAAATDLLRVTLAEMSARIDSILVERDAQRSVAQATESDLKERLETAQASDLQSRANVESLQTIIDSHDTDRKRLEDELTFTRAVAAENISIRAQLEVKCARLRGLLATQEGAAATVAAMRDGNSVVNHEHLATRHPAPSGTVEQHVSGKSNHEVVLAKLKEAFELADWYNKLAMGASVAFSLIVLICIFFLFGELLIFIHRFLEPKAPKAPSCWLI